MYTRSPIIAFELIACMPADVISMIAVSTGHFVAEYRRQFKNGVCDRLNVDLKQLSNGIGTDYFREIIFAWKHSQMTGHYSLQLGEFLFADKLPYFFI